MRAASDSYPSASRWRLNLYEDAAQVLARYGQDEKFALAYVGNLMRTGAVTEAQGNQLLRDYCKRIEDE